jgi:VWFA-related protein
VRVALSLALLVALSATPSPGQEPRPADAAQAPVFRTGAQAVVLDVVARDKKGRTVRDLRAEEFTVLEGGVPRPITSFRFVETPPTPPPAALGVTAAAVAPNPDQIRNPILITLVFDALGMEGRGFAQKAALALLDKQTRSDVFFSVFYVGESLRMLQQFTTERAKVVAAVESACGRIDPRGDMPQTQEIARAAERASSANAALAGQSAPTSAAGAASAGAAAVEAAYANAERQALDFAESAGRQTQGNASLFGLFTLARSQQPLAGRKAIVYFSEGLQVPGPLESLFRSVVSAANRANVSVYGVDVRGLVTGSDFDRARTAIREAGELSRRQTSSRGGSVAVRKEDVMAEEMAEEAITMNSQGMLGSLAEGTGGRLLANSNDVGKDLDKAVDDLVGYYEITYDPQVAEYDGSFRAIDLRLSRKGVEVQTRAGYFALPPGEGSANFPWELPLVTALAASPSPRDFEFRSAIWHFGAEGDGVRHTLVAEVPLDRIKLEPDGKKVRAHFSIMARLRDPAGQVVEHFSQDSPVEAPSDRADALRLGNVLFTRSFRVPPGRYSLEIVVLDQLARGTSVRRSVLLVGPAPPSVGLSSLALVRRTEPLAAGALASPDPLRLGDSRIVPWVGEPVFRAGDTISLYFVAFTRPGTLAPGLTLEFARDGEIVGRSTAELPAPDGQGRIPYVAGIPQSLAPGRYELAAVVRQGDATARERTFFVVAAN